MHSVKTLDLDVIIVSDFAASFSIVSSQGEMCLIMCCPHKLERMKCSSKKAI